jgi:hypothetical protein
MIFERFPLNVFERFPIHIIFEGHLAGAIRAFNNEKLRQSGNEYVASKCHSPPPYSSASHHTQHKLVFHFIWSHLEISV